MTDTPSTDSTGAKPTRKGRGRGRRVAVWALAALVVGGASGYALERTFASTDSAQVMTAPVSVGSVEQSVLANGILKPSKLIAVGAQVSGRITSLNVKVGQTVAEGDQIAEIDSMTQQNALRTAEATLAAARAQKAEKQATLTYATAALARQKATLAQKASSREEYESAEATVKTTRAQIAALDADIASAEVAVATARVNLGYTKITAPMSGTVLAVVSQEGQTVNANQTTPTIVILGQLDVMTIRAEISEADVVKVRPGQDVYFSILGEPGRRYEARLASIEPAPESITSDKAVSSSSSSSSSSTSTTAIYYNGVFDIPNPDGHLRTYMTAEVHIVLGAAKDVLTVPSAAVTSGHNGKSSVRVMTPEGEIERRSVVVGLNDRTTAEIKSGLETGDRVVTGTVTPGASSTPQFRGPGGGRGMRL